MSGEPIAGATVRAWAPGNQNQQIALQPVTTDQNGLFRFQSNENRQMRLHAAFKGQALSTWNYQQIVKQDSTPVPFELTVFFTDRALYRPGQTIHFKGICVAVDQNQGRRRAGAVVGEVGFADGDGNTLQSGIEVLPDLPDVGYLFFGLRIFPLRRISVELRGS